MLTNKDLVKQQFRSMNTRTDIANLLGIGETKLNYVLYLLHPKYVVFDIPKKSGGVRQISAPNGPLKSLQQRLNQVLQCVYKPKPSVYGFISGRNIVQNAEWHKKRRYVLNVDLADFFPSIHFGRVRGMLMKAPYNLPESVAKILAQICCEYSGLPQGAPTSPTIANMICRKMDAELQRLAQRHRCFYTRYADDITFSTSSNHFPSALAVEVESQYRVGDELATIISGNGFRINEKKVRLQTSKQRQEVTGLTVNKFANVQRRYVRQVRTMLNDWRTKGQDAAQEWHFKLHPVHHKPGRKQPVFRDIVRGKIEYIGMVKGKRSSVYQNLAAQLAKLDSTFGKTFEPLRQPSVFINYAREDESIVEKIYDMLTLAGYSVWMDRGEISGGDDWERKILSAIDEASVFIACLSAIAVQKEGFVKRELEYALKRQTNLLPDSNFIIPLRLEKCNPHESLAKLDWIDYFEKRASERLRDAIDRILGF